MQSINPTMHQWRASVAESGPAFIWTVETFEMLHFTRKITFYLQRGYTTKWHKYPNCFICSKCLIYIPSVPESQKAHVPQMSHVSQVAHMSQVFQSVPNIPCVPNASWVPNVPWLCPNFPCVTAPNVSIVPSTSFSYQPLCCGRGGIPSFC